MILKLIDLQVLVVQKAKAPDCTWSSFFSVSEGMMLRRN